MTVAAAESSVPAAVLHFADLTAIGGIPRVVAALASGHQRRGIAVHVALLGTDAALADTLRAPFEASGVTVHHRPVPARAYWRQRRELAMLCRELAPVVMHTHGLRSDVLGGAAARAAGVPVVVTLHGFTGQGLKNAAYEWVHRGALRAADAVVAVSRPVAAKLRAQGVAENRLYTIPNAYAPTGAVVSRAEARRRLGLGEAGAVAGWVGRLSPEKGADVAVEAFARLAHRDARLVILGEGPDRPALEERIRALNMQHRVTLLGTVMDADRLFAAYDVFVLSSRTEGTPIALFEAMHSLTPVVTTAVGGVPDVVTDQHALLVPPDDPGALAAAMDHVLGSPDAAAARARVARQRLDSSYAPEPWLERYEGVYRDVAARTRHLQAK